LSRRASTRLPAPGTLLRAGPGLVARTDPTDPDAPNRITEFLIANAALALGGRGFRRLSMNFAGWGRLFDSGTEPSATQKLLE
jgi:hypothetical protein